MVRSSQSSEHLSKLSHYVNKEPAKMVPELVIHEIASPLSRFQGF